MLAGALLIYKLLNRGRKISANIDLTQLEEKIKKEELKELIVKQNETVGIDNNTATEYHAQLTNEQTKNEVLKPARELGSDGKTARVPKVSDESGGGSD